MFLFYLNDTIIRIIFIKRCHVFWLSISSLFLFRGYVWHHCNQIFLYSIFAFFQLWNMILETGNCIPLDMDSSWDLFSLRVQWRPFFLFYDTMSHRYIKILNSRRHKYAPIFSPDYINHHKRTPSWERTSFFSPNINNNPPSPPIPQLALLQLVKSCIPLRLICFGDPNVRSVS